MLFCSVLFCSVLFYSIPFEAFPEQENGTSIADEGLRGAVWVSGFGFLMFVGVGAGGDGDGWWGLDILCMEVCWLGSGYGFF